MLLAADRPLLLGSASPRRRELLLGVGIPLVTLAPHVDETFGHDEPALDYLARVTSAKLDAVRALAREQHVSSGAMLVADTCVHANGAIVDKPLGPDDARRALAMLAGCTHQVSTRFVIGSGDGLLVVHEETVTTDVTMRALTPGEIDAYVATGEPLDKAGAYGIQGGAAGFVLRIDGSYTAVVGLPLAEVVVALRSAGLWS